MMGITNLFLHPRGSWKKRVNFLGKKWFLWATVLISLVG
jgi:hypothetical protein